MPLPAPLLRNNLKVSKKDFGSILIIAGSASMLGAPALSALAAMRSGAGLVTAAIPRSLNLTLQKKISNVIMTMPVAQDSQGSFSLKAYQPIKKIWDKFDALAIGPGLGRSIGTQKLARQIILHCPKPLVVDADALYALAGHTSILLKSPAPRILTPHTVEMARLSNLSVNRIEATRLKTARDFVKSHQCILLLKGHQTIVASPEGKTYVNKTGNAGMATAGSGDVLTGMIASFLGQGMKPFEAACWGAYLHGAAGDRQSKLKFKTGMIAMDIIENIPYVIKKFSRQERTSHLS